MYTSRFVISMCTVLWEQWDSPDNLHLGKGWTNWDMKQIFDWDQHQQAWAWPNVCGSSNVMEKKWSLRCVFSSPYIISSSLAHSQPSFLAEFLCQRCLKLSIKALPTRQSASSKKNLGEQHLHWHSIRLIVCRCACHPSGAFGFDSSGQCDSGIHVGGQVLKPRSVLSSFVVLDNWQKNKVLHPWWVWKQLPRPSPSAPFSYQCSMQHSLPASPPTLVLTPCFHPAHPA